MNCKPGDLVIVVRVPDRLPAGARERCAMYIGMTFKLTTLAKPNRQGEARWNFEGPPRARPDAHLFFNGQNQTFCVVADCVLQPIRPAPQAKIRTIEREKETT